MNVRLYTVSETALAGMRTRTFRHIHDLSMLHQQSERRGSLVSRVTSDVDQISQFLQWGGVILLVSCGQLTVTTVGDGVYSWQLTLVVFAAFLPLVFVRPALPAPAGRGLRRGPRAGRRDARRGRRERRRRRGDPGVRRAPAHRGPARRGDRGQPARPSSGPCAPASPRSPPASWPPAWPPPAVVVVGVLLGVGGHAEVGQLTAFLFLVTLFVQPVQIATEVLNEAQNAIAGWRRVLDVLDSEPDVADPGDGGRDLPPGPIDVRFPARRTSPTRGGRRRCCADVDLSDRRADPGRRGRRDRQRQDHVREAAHPADGPDPRRGAAVRGPADRGPFASLRAPGGDGAAGRVPVRRHASPTTSGSPGPDLTDADLRAGLRRAGPRRLGRRPAGRPAHPGGRARRGAVGRRAAAGRAGPGVRGRPRPAGARRGDQRGRPGHRGAAAAHPRRGDPGPDHDRDRAPAVHRRERPTRSSSSTRASSCSAARTPRW